MKFTMDVERFDGREDDYLKFCTVDLEALERDLASRYSRPATYCRQCMEKGE
ncbi:hypothetical protein [Luteimonas arsenica]|uniref:hypothetical protein n=1 Tax=Luteimonas arsenica TaxID=1586242 RepID=UPI001405272A|nr:hypothetical protein [Luteimonas arsenica]